MSSKGYFLAKIDLKYTFHRHFLKISIRDTPSIGVPFFKRAETKKEGQSGSNGRGWGNFFVRRAWALPKNQFIITFSRIF